VLGLVLFCPSALVTLPPVQDSSTLVRAPFEAALPARLGHPTARARPLHSRSCPAQGCSALSPSPPNCPPKTPPLPFVPRPRLVCPLALVSMLLAQELSTPGRSPPKAALPTGPRHPTARPRPLYSLSCSAQISSALSPSPRRPPETLTFPFVLRPRLVCPLTLVTQPQQERPR